MKQTRMHCGGFTGSTRVTGARRSAACVALTALIACEPKQMIIDELGFPFEPYQSGVLLELENGVTQAATAFAVDGGAVWWTRRAGALPCTDIVGADVPDQAFTRGACLVALFYRESLEELEMGPGALEVVREPVGEETLGPPLPLPDRYAWLGSDERWQHGSSTVRLFLELRREGGHTNTGCELYAEAPDPCPRIAVSNAPFLVAPYNARTLWVQVSSQVDLLAKGACSRDVPADGVISSFAPGGMVVGRENLWWVNTDPGTGRSQVLSAQVFFEQFYINLARTFETRQRIAGRSDSIPEALVLMDDTGRLRCGNQDWAPCGQVEDPTMEFTEAVPVLGGLLTLGAVPGLLSGGALSPIDLGPAWFPREAYTAGIELGEDSLRQRSGEPGVVLAAITTLGADGEKFLALYRHDPAGDSPVPLYGVLKISEDEAEVFDSTYHWTPPIRLGGDPNGVVVGTRHGWGHYSRARGSCRVRFDKDVVIGMGLTADQGMLLLTADPSSLSVFPHWYNRH